MIRSSILTLLFALGAHATEPIKDTADRFGWPITKWLYDYTPLRKALHQRIVDRHLQAGTSEDKPRLIFTAGGYGAGKSYVTGILEKLGVLDVGHFLWVDPDPLKEEIPEYAELTRQNPETAATLVHRESGHIQLLLVEAALGAKKNIIIDGSLRAKDWWDEEFKRIRKDYPEYSISIFYVTADDESIVRRVRERALVTGRHIPEHVVREAAAEVRESVEHLASLADFTVEIENGLSPTIKSILHKGRKVQTHLNLIASPPPEIVPTPVGAPSEFEKVVVLTGYGKIGYEDYSLLQSYVRTIAARNPEKTLYVVGTPFGIGRARQWLPFSAEHGEEEIKRLFTEPGLEGKVEVFALRGGPATVRVIESARSRAVPVTLVQDPGLEPETEGVALRLMRDPNFRPNATHTFELRPEGVKVVRSLDVPEVHRVFEQRTRRLRHLYRAIEKVSDRDLVTTAIESYPELLLLTEGTIANPEAASSASLPPRVAPLPDELSHFRQENEPGYPVPVADVPDSFDHSFSRHYFGKAYPEYDRTISMLLMFKRILANDYEGFVRGQPEDMKLGRASFEQLVAFMRNVAYDTSTRDALFSFLIFNNVGKAKPVIDYLRTAGNVRDFNHQRIMAHVLEAYAFVSPTLRRLDETQQRLILSAFEREFALGQHTHGELPARFLAESASRGTRARDFYFATYCLKAAAGRGHVRHLGSLVMTEPMYRGARAAIESLESLDGKRASAVAAQDEFLRVRALALMPADADLWTVRVALMLRLLRPSEGEALWAAITALPAPDRALLEREFTATGHDDDPALLLYYATAVFDNLRKVTAGAELYPKALGLLTKILRAARPKAVGGVTQVRLDRVAAAIRDHEFLPETYAIETYEDESYGLSVRLASCDFSLSR